ncbi:MAG: dedicator of cytokinesis 6, isoform CRA_e, partial [Olpidium bornovanus]
GKFWKACYTERFGLQFQLLQDSNRVDRAKLDPEKAYVQVTFVEPYLDSKEQAKRTTYFERMTDIKKFVFETPYTTSGKAHGNVANQRKRKTILTTEHPFPYLKKRLPVVSREELDLTPLEVSIEAIYERCNKLRTAIQANPPNLKNLQMVLQGSVRLQVNSGPLEICNAFLAPQARAQHRPAQLAKLQGEFQEFEKLCGQALELNKLLIKHDQIEYQEDLEEGYEDFKVKLEPFLIPVTEGDAQNAAQWADASDPVSNVLDFIKSSSAPDNPDSLLTQFFK